MIIARLSVYATTPHPMLSKSLSSELTATNLSDGDRTPPCGFPLCSLLIKLVPPYSVLMVLSFRRSPMRYTIKLSTPVSEMDLIIEFEKKRCY